MELTWIDDFIALEQTCNFTIAANKRNTTQSAFSRRIQSLEAWIGSSLFNRDTRPISLTASGIEFQKRIHSIRSDIIDLQRITRVGITNMHEPTVIYTTNTIAIGLLPQWIKSKKLSNYRLVISSVSNCIEAVQQSKANIAIIPNLHNKAIKNLTYKPIAQDRLCFISTYLNPNIFQNKQLQGNILMYSPKTFFGEMIERKLKDHQIAINGDVICESASAEALLAQIKDGIGGGWVPESLCQNITNIRYHDEIFDIPFEVVMIHLSPSWKMPL